MDGMQTVAHIFTYIYFMCLSASQIHIVWEQLATSTLQICYKYCHLAVSPQHSRRGARRRAAADTFGFVAQLSVLGRPSGRPIRADT